MTYEIGAYYFPNYHLDARNESAHGKGWTEWELVRHAGPRFPGHQQPKIPLWGYEDEADPRVMARKIDAAADHGLNHFIFDWYWYDDGPFLGRALDEGFLPAANNDRLKFALMWANHDWIDIHPAKIHGPKNTLYPGVVTRRTFETVVDFVIEKYFRHPSYWCIDGSPYFSFYELMTLMRGLGGVEAARDGLLYFRERARRAGFATLHLNAVVWGVQILPNEQSITRPQELLQWLGFDSVTSYVWIHDAALPTFPQTPYTDIMRQVAARWRGEHAEYGLPYQPNVTMGWDSSPRTVRSDTFQNAGYPFMPMLGDNSPANFRTALQLVKSFLDESAATDGIKRFSINAWNEWTEGSYLEPDTQNGYAYLEAIGEVFGAP